MQLIEKLSHISLKTNILNNSSSLNKIKKQDVYQKKKQDAYQKKKQDAYQKKKRMFIKRRNISHIHVSEELEPLDDPGFPKSNVTKR